MGQRRLTDKQRKFLYAAGIFGAAGLGYKLSYAKGASLRLPKALKGLGGRSKKVLGGIKTRIPGSVSGRAKRAATYLKNKFRGTSAYKKYRKYKYNKLRGKVEARRTARVQAAPIKKEIKKAHKSDKKSLTRQREEKLQKSIKRKKANSTGTQRRRKTKRRSNRRRNK